MNTLALNDNWDLYAENGNIAMFTSKDALAQDMASACRLFLGELWYDTTQGVLYWQILSKLPPLSFIKASYVAAALTVPGVVAAVCYISGIANRTMTGQVQGTDTAGTIIPVGF